MLWFLTIPVIGFFTFKNLIQGDWLILRESPADWPFLAWVFTIFIGCFFTALIFSPLFGVACWLGSLPKCIAIKDQEYPLVTLREKDGVSGHFYFLGAGSISDVQYYFWYRRQGDSIRGGKTYRSSGVRVYEIGDSSVPRMVTWKTSYKAPGIASILWLYAIDLRDDEGWYPDFYIPEGSIKEGYAL